MNFTGPIPIRIEVPIANDAFNAVVQQMLTAEGVDCLPIVLIDGRIVSWSEYPSRENLALWTDTKLPKPTLPIASNDECCGDTGCC